MNQKHAVLIWGATNYTLDWGTQVFDGPHMLIDGMYGSALKAFFDSHQPTLYEEGDKLFVKVKF